MHSKVRFKGKINCHETEVIWRLPPVLGLGLVVNQMMVIGWDRGSGSRRAGGTGNMRGGRLWLRWERLLREKRETHFEVGSLGGA